MSFKKNIVLATLLVGVFLVSAFKVEAAPPQVVPNLAVVFGGKFWFNAVKYETISLPTDFTDTGAPDSTFNRIFVIKKQLSCDPDPTHLNVIDSAPGERGFNGGRWKVYIVDFGTSCESFTYAVANYARNGVDFEFAEDLLNAIDSGFASLGQLLKTFECPVKRLN
ncbi:hypothetical protein G9A89_017272 [Geosiphon pyriformis]|nr:hypothetical protein G9A89_017272 [Geosiphon pyriformis]